MDVRFIFFFFCDNFLTRNGVCLGWTYVIRGDSSKGERSGLESKRPFCRFFLSCVWTRSKIFLVASHSYSVRNRIIASVLCVVPLVPKI
jgi:hypothetical protein